MQLIKWCAVPASVLVAAFALAVTSQFDSTPISILYAFSSLAALYLWRRAPYGLGGSIKNVDFKCSLEATDCQNDSCSRIGINLSY